MYSVPYKTLKDTLSKHSSNLSETFYQDGICFGNPQREAHNWHLCSVELGSVPMEIETWIQLHFYLHLSESLNICDPQLPCL